MSETVSDQLLADVEEAMRDVVDPELVSTSSIWVWSTGSTSRRHPKEWGRHGVCRRHDHLGGLPADR